MNRTAVVLAAGEGRRFLSQTPKPLHKVAHRPMLWHVLDAVRASGALDAVVVVGHQADVVGASAQSWSSETGLPVRCVVQSEQKGTGHAVAAALPFVPSGASVLVAYGDTPLFTPATLRALWEKGQDRPCFLGFATERPQGYGRLVSDGDVLRRIVEERDADAQERLIGDVAAGPMAAPVDQLRAALERVGPSPVSGEIYLTSIPEHVASTWLLCPMEESLGVNDRVQLAHAEDLWQARLRLAAMRGGTTLVGASTVFFAWDTVLGADVEIEPGVVCGPGVVVESGARVRAHSHLEGAWVGPRVEVGPFARLRPGTRLEEGSRVGNFVETKNTRLGPGAKAGHLAYLGDADVGEGANIGAGTITCNFDGKAKHRTVVGPNAFIGSNSALVAPVSVGQGALVAAGSVITDDVPDGARAFGRARQTNKPPRA